MKIILFIALLAALYFVGKRALSKRSNMGKGEAAKLLGVATDADSEAVLEAHRRLIAKVHPDAGGNAELASRITEAAFSDLDGPVQRVGALDVPIAYSQPLEAVTLPSPASIVAAAKKALYR